DYYCQSYDARLNNWVF
nr:immunoglobulin light chain junction region [Macaca mulatta]MOX77329.1 immunoglobulin light chain junction region [Macaca mulatta]